MLAATNRILSDEVRAGSFRADLFHQLNVYPLHVPPLRERCEDIPLLSGYFCDVARRRLGLGPVRIAAEAMGPLAAASWPGNVRELENAISRAVLKASAEVPRGEPVIVSAPPLGLEHSPAPAQASHTKAVAPGTERPPTSLPEAVRDFQRAVIRRALEENGESWAAAARALGVDRGNLHHLARRLGLTLTRTARAKGG